jgi:hypothetical protein
MKAENESLSTQSLYRLSKEETMGSHLFVAQAVETF